MVKSCALVVAATAILISAASASTVPPDAPNQQPFSLSSLQEHCDDQTGAAIVASVGSEYHFTLRPRSEINLPSAIPLTVRIAYRGGALTCYPAIIPPEGSTRPQISAQVGAVMHVEFFTAGGAFNEQFETEFKGRSGGVNFGYSTTPDKLQGTYRPDLPGYTDVAVGFAASFGGESNGEVNQSGIPPEHVSEYIPVARWATYLDQTPVPTSEPTPTPTETPTSDACPKKVTLTASDGPVGSTLALMGWCATLQSDSNTVVFFEDEAVSSLVVDPAGIYQAEFQVPVSAAHGTHAVRVWAAGIEIGSATFQVTHPALRCVGDCDGVHAVSVNQLVTMVNIALGNVPIETCSGGDADGSETIEVNEIITAVENALDDCSLSQWRESCHDQSECNRKPCTSNEECSQHFTCMGTNDSGNRTCQRVQCRTDTDCVEGFCLAGQCFGQLGTCIPGDT